MSISLDATQIQKILGVTYPLVLVDRVIELHPGKKCHAIKNISYNEWFVPAHWPDYPVMPGILQLDALAQAMTITVLYGQKITSNPTMFLTGVDKCRFFNPVVPGDTLDLFVEVKSVRLGIVIGSGVAKVNGVTVCECKITEKIPENILAENELLR